MDDEKQKIVSLQNAERECLVGVDLCVLGISMPFFIKQVSICATKHSKIRILYRSSVTVRLLYAGNT
jgi:hypothetical protein